MRASLLLLVMLLPLAAQQDKSLAARVQRLEDIEEIRTVERYEVTFQEMP